MLVRNCRQRLYALDDLISAAPAEMHSSCVNRLSWRLPKQSAVGEIKIVTVTNIKKYERIAIFSEAYIHVSWRCLPRG